MGRALTARFGSFFMFCILLLYAYGESVSGDCFPKRRREGHSGWELSKMKVNHALNPFHRKAVDSYSQ